MIPVNRQSGTNVGIIATVAFFPGRYLPDHARSAALRKQPSLQGGRRSATDHEQFIFIVRFRTSCRRGCPAFAHAMLDHASPRSAVTVATGAEGGDVWFTKNLEPAFSSIEVRDEKGASMQAGKASVDRGNRTQLRVALKSLPPGTYKVIWRVSVGGYPPHARRFHLPRRAVVPAGRGVR